MNTAPTSPASNGATFTDQANDLLNTYRENLRQLIAYRGVDIDEVERMLGVYVAELKGRGCSPGAVVVDVKQLLAEQEFQTADGRDATRALRVVHHSSEWNGAIVTLAIAQYYGIRLHATDLARTNAAL
jgi:hypothetical protein